MDIITVKGGVEIADPFLKQIHALRARVFGDRLGWHVSIRDGQETDSFDACNPTFVALRSKEGRAVGCARFLPLSGITMIGSVFSFLAGGKLDGIPGPAVESSRFCVDTEACSANGAGGLNRATSLLIAGMIDWSAMNGFRTIATVTDIRIERLLRRCGVPFSRLAEPQVVGETRAVAGIVPVSRELADGIYPPGAARLVDTVVRAA
ncbi:acyl-homoserine-lactone synthase [Pelagibacterium halotolerans]|uniref:acyl-homoserine-lactone synthase n=1 Tax=Pelagibacterium halotolerans TaxID=531813 RepID=UPI00384C212A